MNSRALPSIGVIILFSLLLAGCSAPATPQATATPSQSTSTLGAGFYDPDAPPAPEGTIAPKPGSWDDAHPPAGYTVILLTYGTDAPTRTLVRAIDKWADTEKVRLTTVVVASPAKLIGSVYDAVAEGADLVMTAGNAMVDPLAAVSPGVLHQQFLVVGAEIAEPTGNVTAADWTGASYRGEGLGTPTHYDPKTFTSARADRAIRAGMAAVLNKLTGIVVWVD